MLSGSADSYVRYEMAKRNTSSLHAPRSVSYSPPDSFPAKGEDLILQSRLRQGVIILMDQGATFYVVANLRPVALALMPTAILRAYAAISQENVDIRQRASVGSI